MVSKVLATPRRLSSTLGERRLDGGVAGRVLHVAVQLGHQRLCADEYRSTAGKAIHGVICEYLLDAHER